MATITQARDDIATIINTAAVAQSATVDWPDKAARTTTSEDFPPTSGTAIWYRPLITHTGGGRRTLGDGNGVSSYIRTGLVLVNIFTPRGSGLSDPDNEGIMLLNAFEQARTTTNGVSFSETQYKELGEDGIYFVSAVQANFQYRDTN